jgi:pimeloyl-ACP methyl ester carboxylesterase
MGYYSLGGVALQIAIRHYGVVRKLVLVSIPFKRDGWYPEILAGMGQMGSEAAEPMKGTPMYQSSTPASRRGRRAGELRRLRNMANLASTTKGGST